MVESRGWKDVEPGEKGAELELPLLLLLLESRVVTAIFDGGVSVVTEELICWENEFISSGYSPEK